MGVGMFDMLLAYRWIILIALEVLAWASTFFMLYARYGMRSKRWFRVGAVLFAITGVIPQVALGVLNFAATREVDTFTLAIVLLLLYGFTIGKKDVQKLDAWAQKKFAKKEEPMRETRP
jgi:hypothetical protein